MRIRFFTQTFFLALLGWFSLNVPSGLTLYWLTNNIITTGQQVCGAKTYPQDDPQWLTTTYPQPPVLCPSQLWLRNQAKASYAGAGAGSATIDVNPTPSSSTRVVDVEVQDSKPSGRELDSRGKKKKAAAAAEAVCVGCVSGEMIWCGDLILLS